MNPFRKLRFRLRALFRGARLDRDMADEMRVHLDMQEAENHADGMGADEARCAARRQFGGIDQIKEQAREQRGWVWLEQLGKDFGLAARVLRKSPGFTAVSALTLAAGLAATTSLFVVVKGLLLEPLPYPEPGRLATLWRKSVGSTLDYTPLTTMDYFDLQDRAASFSGIGAFSMRRHNLGGNRPEGIEGTACTPGLFRVLGVLPLHGRWFAQEDENGDATAVVMLSHALWKQRFASDPAVVGQTIRLDGRDHTVVGVMPEGFALLSLWTRNRPDALWTMLSLRRGTGSGYWLGGIARLNSDATIGQAGEELKMVARQIAEADPNRDARKTIWTVPLAIELGGIPALRVSILLGAGWTLLVLAAKNVAGMLLARGLGRQPEMAMRMALGARRGHIVRLVLAESLLLSLLACSGGFVLTLWCLSALSRLLPVEVLPRSGLGVDAGLVGCIVALTLVSTQMAGLAPALLASKTDVVGSLKEGGVQSSQTRRTHRKLRSLIISQIAIALMLVAVAFQLSNTYRHTLSGSRALVSESVLTASIVAKGPGYAQGAARVAFWQRLCERCAALPGVQAAAVTTKLPFDGGVALSVLIDDQVFKSAEAYPWVEESCISPDFFEALEARLVQGRLMTRDDDTRPRDAVVINQTMARRFWPGQNPIGRRIRPAQSGQAWSAEVVGVVEDIRQFVDRSPRPEMYFPFTANPCPDSFLVLRTAPGLVASVESIRQELTRIDGDLALASVRTLGRRFHQQVRVLSVITSLVDMLMVAILGLAALGLYGTLSFHFAQRRREIGIRLALGAASRDIVLLVFTQAAIWVGAGLVAGVGGAWAVAAVMNRVLEGAAPFNATNVALGAAVVLGAALVAAWLPARRATRIDPVNALRAG